MRFLFVDANYPAPFLSSFYDRHPDLGQLSYQDGWQKLMDEGLGVGGFYSESLKKLGHEAREIIPNCEPLQRQWAAENGVGVSKKINLHSRARRTLQNIRRKLQVVTDSTESCVCGVLRTPLRKFLERSTAEPWMCQILAAQIEQARPDVLLNHALGQYNKHFLRRVRPFVKLIVGQHASSLPQHVPYDSYDLILSSLPNLVSYFRSRGVKSEYLRLGFGASILDRLGLMHPLYNVSFIGGYSPGHRSGTRVLERVATEVPVDFWGYGIGSLSLDSPILRRYHGEVWGMEMYRILAQSKIVLNRHISVADNYANNMRLYEATGVGALLITDAKANLNDLFEEGKEVIAYRNGEECVELVRYYLEHEGERSAIAKAGQQRTLREHTYFHRMQELVEIIKRYLP